MSDTEARMSVTRRRTIFACVAAVLAAGVAPTIWYGVFLGIQTSWPSPLLTGLLIGGLMRLVGGRARDMVRAVVAVVLTVLASAAGYIWIDMTLMWEPPSTFPVAVRHLMRDLVSIVLIAFGAYLAYLFNRPSIAP